MGLLLVLAGLLAAAAVGGGHLARGWTPPPDVSRIVGFAATAIAALVPVGLAFVALRRRRLRGVVLVVVGWVAASAVAFALGLLTPLPARPAIGGAVWFAGLAASVIVAGPWLSRRTRRGLWAVALVAAAGCVVAGAAVTGAVIALGAGVASGAAVLLVFGARERRPRGSAVAAAMARAGVPLARLVYTGAGAGGSILYAGDAQDGRRLFIKVLERDARSADLLYRAYRFLRVKDVGDQQPFRSLAHAAADEAHVARYALGRGIPTPRLAATAAVGDEGYLLAYEQADGLPFDRLDAEGVTDDAMRGLWRVVARMRRHGIAHRDLRPAHVLLTPGGSPCLVDFGRGATDATRQMLDTDVAELLASTALTVGVRRAVDAAVEVLGAGAVASAAPRIQPLALNPATRKALRARRPLCDDLRKYAGEASGAGDVEPADLERIRWRTVLVFATLAVAFYVLIPQLADVSGVWSSIEQADWTWALWALAMMVLTYAGATIGLLAAVPSRIPFLGTLIAQVAGSFVNRIVPARVGGIATNVRYLQKQGVDLAVASSGIGLQQVAGIIMHAALSFVFLVWAGRSGSEALHSLPSERTVLAGLTVVLALSGLLLLLPAGRRLLRRRVAPVLRRSGRGIGEVARRPLRLVGLFGGSALLTLSSIAALALCLHAFGSPGVSVASIGVVYLLGSAVSSAAPTPGNLGAVEAALIAGLTAVGVDRDVAVPAVFLFRIVSFWLPILPGWVALVALERRGDL